MDEDPGRCEESLEGGPYGRRAAVVAKVELEGRPQVGCVEDGFGEPARALSFPGLNLRSLGAAEVGGASGENVVRTGRVVSTRGESVGRVRLAGCPGRSNRFDEGLLDLRRHFVLLPCHQGCEERGGGRPRSVARGTCWRFRSGPIL